MANKPINFKIIFLGPSGAGKTTLKKVFFEQASTLRLLSNPLEPTLGLDTQIYDIGANRGLFAIHDLAGQQLEEWMSVSQDYFLDSDLVVIVLDCRDSWEENRNLVKKVENLRDKLCKAAKIIVLIHKIDLLEENQRSILSIKADASLSTIPNLSYFLSSIAHNFFNDTFLNFVNGLRNCIENRNEIQLSLLFQKVEILNRFLKYPEISLEDLMSTSNLPNDTFLDILDGMHRKNLLNIDTQAKKVTLGLKGKYFVMGLKNQARAVTGRIGQDPLALKIIQGILLSDGRGLKFFEYEQDEGFFESLTPHSQEGGPDTSMITSFISAIGAFGYEIGEGISTINLKGSKAQILSLGYEEEGDLQVSGIFFIDNVPMTIDAVNILIDFLRNFTRSFPKELRTFQTYGLLNAFRTREEEIVEMIHQIEPKLQKLILQTGSVSPRKLTSMYNKIDLLEASQTIKVKLKRVIFQYAVTSDHRLIEQVQQLMEKYGIEE